LCRQRFAIARMCKRFRYYNSFITDTDQKTLADYISLFRRSICVDIILAVVYGVLGGIQICLHPQVLDSLLGIISSAVLVLVSLFWLLDAALMARFKQVVEAWSGAGDPPSEVTTWFHICVVSATVGIVLYFIRLALEVASSFALTHDIHQQLYGYLITLLLAGLKIMRVLAVNSFSRWLGMAQSKKTAPPQQYIVGNVV
jgi:hypothetical protein